jgi:hypothetical protein
MDRRLTIQGEIKAMSPPHGANGWNLPHATPAAEGAITVPVIIALRTSTKRIDFINSKTTEIEKVKVFDATLKQRIFWLRMNLGRFQQAVGQGRRSNAGAGHPSRQVRAKASSTATIVRNRDGRIFAPHFTVLSQVRDRRIRAGAARPDHPDS